MTLWWVPSSADQRPTITKERATTKKKQSNQSRNVEVEHPAPFLKQTNKKKQPMETDGRISANQANPNLVRQYRFTSGEDGLETTMASLSFVVQEKHLADTGESPHSSLPHWPIDDCVQGAVNDVDRSYQVLNILVMDHHLRRSLFLMIPVDMVFLVMMYIV